MTLVTVDFDGTLFKGNSFKVMFQAATKDFTWKDWSGVVGGLIKAVGLWFVKGKNAFRLAFFAAFAKGFKGKTKQELDRFFHQLVDIGRNEVHYGLIQKIKDHQKNGDTVIILSGALLPFLQAFTKEMGLDVAIISTELKFDQNGVCTGKIGPIVNGNEKVKRVESWLKQHGYSTDANVDNPEVWAYADSESDIPLFQFATHPIVVNPDEPMKKIAEENEWPIWA